MAEQELKLHVPRQTRKGIERELARGTVTRIPLRAMYFDTPNRALVKAKVGLRLRQEGSQWVQTLKMPGDHALSRLELNHDRVGPVLDLSVYLGTPAEPILASLTETLGVCYETDIRRTLRKIRTRQGTVEVAFDLGRIRAGALDLPVSEVEFELLSGELTAIFALGQRWQQAHGLVFDARSKAERGDRLAQTAHQLAALDAQANPDGGELVDKARQKIVARFWQERNIAAIALEPEFSTSQALAAVTMECLDQITRNAAVLAEIDTAGICAAGAPEHVHQIRVGIRRLRSAWSLFNGLAPLPPLELRNQIKGFFGQLGGARDDDVLRETLLPVLEASGQPPVVLESDLTTDHTSALCAGHAFQGWVLALMAWTLDATPLSSSTAAGSTNGIAPGAGLSYPEVGATNPVASSTPTQASGNDGTSAGDSQSGATVNHVVDNEIPAGDPDHHGARLAAQIIPMTAAKIVVPTLTETLSGKLKKWHRQVVRDGLAFEELDIEARHELRKRVKRLRYGLQFCESLLPSNRLKLYRKQLAVVQDVLGEMNDLAVARERFEGLKATQPQAWFAVGWTTSRLEALVHQAVSAFKVLARAERFWR